MAESVFEQIIGLLETENERVETAIEAENDRHEAVIGALDQERSNLDTVRQSIDSLQAQAAEPVPTTDGAEQVADASEDGGAADSTAPTPDESVTAAPATDEGVADANAEEQAPADEPIVAANPDQPAEDDEPTAEEPGEDEAPVEEVVEDEETVVETEETVEEPTAATGTPDAAEAVPTSEDEDGEPETVELTHPKTGAIVVVSAEDIAAAKDESIPDEELTEPQQQLRNSDYI